MYVCVYTNIYIHIYEIHPGMIFGVTACIETGNWYVSVSVYVYVCVYIYTNIYIHIYEIHPGMIFGVTACIETGNWYVCECVCVCVVCVCVYSGVFIL